MSSADGLDTTKEGREAYLRHRHRQPTELHQTGAKKTGTVGVDLLETAELKVLVDWCHTWQTHGV
jgi:hypothetical protein